MGGSNSMHTHSNCLICMCFIRINTVISFQGCGRKAWQAGTNILVRVKYMMVGREYCGHFNTAVTHDNAIARPLQGCL